MASELDLDFWIKNGLNVIFRGKHGTGKTTQVLEAFKKNNLKYQYFSASTMDPWVDFIGVPKEKIDANGEPYLDLIRPKHFQNDEVEAIFLDEFNRCLTGDTKIPLADGHSVAIKDLVGKDHFFVYSYDHENRRISIARGHSARLTEKNAKLLKVTLDNGTSIRCTEDELFLGFDGTYCRADNLKVGISMLPLYRLWDSNRKSLSGYEQVWQPKKNSRWEVTYGLADEYNMRNSVYTYESGDHRHHIDFNKSNNSPENIVRLQELEHMKLHSSDKDFTSMAGKLAHVNHPDLYNRTIATPESRKKAMEKSTQTRRTSKTFKEKRSELSKSIYTDEMRSYRSEVTKVQWRNGQFSKIDRIESLRKNQIMRIYNRMVKNNIAINSLTEESYNEFRSFIIGKGNALLTLETILEWFSSFDNFKTKMIEIDFFKKNGNHKIISIEDGGTDDVYDITVDEFNNFALENGIFVHNCGKKVRNAVLELIQFKSINGKKFNNLKIIWAAINPEDDEVEHYDVEDLDAAQLDRFHVIVDVDYKPHAPYFRDKYGEDIANIAITWWKELKEDEKNLVSPRRLDYALDIHAKGGDIKHVLNKKINTNKLSIELQTGSISKKLQVFADAKDIIGAKEFLSIENYYSACENYIIKNRTYHEFFLPLIPEEKLVKLMESDRGVENHIFGTYNGFEDIIQNLANSDSGKLAKPAKECILSNAKQRYTSDGRKLNNSAKFKYSKTVSLSAFKVQLEQELRKPMKNATERESMYNFLDNNISKNLDDKTAEKTMAVLVDILLASPKDVITNTFSRLIPLLNHTCNHFTFRNLDIPIDGKVLDRISDEFNSFVLLKNTPENRAKTIDTNRKKVLALSSTELSKSDEDNE